MITTFCCQCGIELKRKRNKSGNRCKKCKDIKRIINTYVHNPRDFFDRQHLISKIEEEINRDVTLLMDYLKDNINIISPGEADTLWKWMHFKENFYNIRMFKIEYDKFDNQGKPQVGEWDI